MTIEYIKENYPWLAEVTYAAPEGVYYDECPVGWNYIIEMIAEEIKPIIEREHLDYHIVQIKEKYGELRWYADGGNRDIEHIIDAYAAASYNICNECGRPDSAVLKRGWIVPICRECYKRYKSNIPYDAVVSEDNLMTEEWGYRRFEQNEWKKVKFSNHELNIRIRNRWGNE